MKSGPGGAVHDNLLHGSRHKLVCGNATVSVRELPTDNPDYIWMLQDRRNPENYHCTLWIRVRFKRYNCLGNLILFDSPDSRDLFKIFQRIREKKRVLIEKIKSIPSEIKDYY